MADNGLEMSDHEIKVMYLNAKNKGEQAKILADLNGCSVEDIKRAGVDQHQLPRTGKNMKKEAENEKIKEFQKIKEESTQENNSLERANHKLLVENSELKEQLEKAKDEIDSLNALISDMQQAAADESEVDTICEEYKELRIKYLTLETDYVKLNQQIESQSTNTSENELLKLDIQDRDDYIQLLKDTIVDMVVKKR